MELRFLYHGETDRQKWEECVSESINAGLYAHTWFLDSVFSEWAAVVADDYEAVMPVFFSGNRIFQPPVMLWTGIYSRKMPDENLCGEFADFLSRRFKHVETVFDRFSCFGKFKNGRVSQKRVFLFDTVKNFKERIRTATLSVKRFMINFTRTGLKVESVSDPAFIETFLRYNPATSGFGKTDLLTRVITNAMTNKTAASFALKNSNGVTEGLITALFAENYIFVPHLTLSPKVEKNTGQMVLLYHVLSFFDGTPAVVAIDAENLGIRDLLLAGMGGKDFYVKVWKIDALSKAMNFFHL